MSQPTTPVEPTRPQPTPANPFPIPPQLPPRGPQVAPEATFFPAQTLPITVLAYPCGHIEGDLHDEACAYWSGVATGEYPPPEAYLGGLSPDGDMEPVTLPPHCPGLAPLVDPALREVA